MPNLFLLLVIAAFVVSNGIASLAATDSNKTRSLKAAENEAEAVTHALDGKRFLMQTENVKVSGSTKERIAASSSKSKGYFKKLRWAKKNAGPKETKKTEKSARTFRSKIKQIASNTKNVTGKALEAVKVAAMVVLDVGAAL
ncbi:RxLR-like protein [Plasmopara halstedii]|uniref:RxLR-like protein n=1 Tax=Plasmopara halstedii TaxID=4781 RepID=A0A0P1AUV0_PLAHL|nr:RxLR-like protein [Plasmopara halstedii]CEG45136.1 RxLR-like protein [Plasmopara halstedii]|eukprot:XP_024581505.1 RxLR-like protein [Plasmopara halstedii]